MSTRLPAVGSHFTDGSNIGIPGVYAYRIDGERIFEPGERSWYTKIWR